MASTMTMSSTGSSRAPPNGRMVHNKKLQGFFGDEPPLREGRFGSDASSASLAEGVGRPGYSRTTSMKDGFTMSGQATPDQGVRPKTPQAASSEVTPWEFQDPQVSSRDPVVLSLVFLICCLGHCLIRRSTYQAGTNYYRKSTHHIEKAFRQLHNNKHRFCADYRQITSTSNRPA